MGQEKQIFYNLGKELELYPPKFDSGEYVKLALSASEADSGNYSKSGQIWVVDVGGALGYDNHTYDVFIEEENCLCKHIPEEWIRPIEKQ